MCVCVSVFVCVVETFIGPEVSPYRLASQVCCPDIYRRFPKFVVGLSPPHCLTLLSSFTLFFSFKPAFILPAWLFHCFLSFFSVYIIYILWFFSIVPPVNTVVDYNPYPSLVLYTLKLETKWKTYIFLFIFAPSLLARWSISSLTANLDHSLSSYASPGLQLQ